MAVENQNELDPKEKARRSFMGENSTDKTAAKIAAEKEAEDKRLLDEADEKAKIETERLRLEAEKNKNTPTVIAPDLTDETVLAYLKSKNINVASLTELSPKQTDDEKKKIEDQKEADKLSFGLTNGLFNRNTYESFISDRKDRLSLVYKAELEEAKAGEAEWDEEKEKEFKESFDAEFGIGLDPSSTKFKRGQKKLATISDAILRETYAPIYTLDGKYSDFDSRRQAQSQEQQKILTEAPKYKEDVDAVLNDFVKIPVAMGKDGNFDIPVSETIRNGVKELLLDESFVRQQILAGHKKENLANVAKTIIISQNFAELTHEAAKLYRLKHEKGLRGIPPSGDLEKTETENENLTDNQKKALAFFKPITAPVAN